MSVQLSVDIGGTFTDVVLLDGDRLHSAKVLTTHQQPSAGVIEGIKTVLTLADVAADAVAVVLHGTTLATNALIERRGARTALLTTQGHRDVLEMALENRFEQYDLYADRPKPLVPRERRIAIEERIAADGEVLVPLDEASVDAACRQLDSLGVESVAVGLLHSYAFPQHEQRIAELLSERMPHLAVSLSSAVCPEVREYERFSTCVANAYVMPLMASYLNELERDLRSLDVQAPMLLMTSGGGLTTLAAAKAFPIRLVESGPAGGAILAEAVAHHSGAADAMSFDMGGTTAKVCLIEGGQALQSRSFEVDRAYRFKKGSGIPVRIPCIEMVEIGAGGGSIAQVDRLNRVQVGPQSAGSQPGPAAYGRGGVDATVTDANLVLGRLLADRFAGGNLVLDTTAAENALNTAVGEPLALDGVHAADAVIRTVDENMASAARAHAAEWGQDNSGRTLIAFGGGAPLHAGALCQILGMSEVIVPQHAGVGSALGFLLAPARFEVVRSLHTTLANYSEVEVAERFAEMFEEAFEVIAPLVDRDDVRVIQRAYMRFVGQGFEIAVTLPEADVVQPVTAAQLSGLFVREYERLYGRSIPGLDVEVLSWTLTLTGPTPELGIFMPKDSVRTAPAAPVAEAAVHFGSEEAMTAQVFQRDAFSNGQTMDGPALIVESQSTTVVPPRMRARIDDLGQIRLTPKKSEAAAGV